MRAWVLAVALCSCRHAAPPAPPPKVAPDLREQLARHVVTDADFARRVFYTWTTPKQIEALRASRQLLVATASEGFGRSRFILDLEDALKKRAAGFETARVVLEHPQLSRRRYAWPSPFATRMGLALRGYGDALIRVVLKEGTHIARFDPSTPWSIVDTSGARVDALDPEKLGAVFHVRYVPPATAPFREYVLCNEARVESWSVGTDDIKHEIDEERSLLAALANETIVPVPSWPALADTSLGASWHASLAFDNERYAPTRDRLLAIAKSLESYAPTPPAFVGP
jgi:hypothetical protein